MLLLQICQGFDEKDEEEQEIEAQCTSVVNIIVHANCPYILDTVIAMKINKESFLINLHCKYSSDRNTV